MKKGLTVGLCVLFISGVVSAENVRDIHIDFVTVGNPGNLGDTRRGGLANPYGSGSVNYEYQIGKYEITNAQWDAFVVAAGAPTGNPSIAYDENTWFNGSQQPTNVSWHEALQFCNYLTTGDKSQGVYEFGGNNANPGDFLGINRSTAEASYGTIYFLPTEDEWYKAAYYKPDGSGYSLYANGTNTSPIAGIEANYDYGISQLSQPWNIGSGTIEQNGTFDMMGNVYEWNETAIWNEYASLWERGARGGSFDIGGNNVESILSSSNRGIANPIVEEDSLGFRIAVIPEPCSLVLLSLGGLALRSRKR